MAKKTNTDKTVSKAAAPKARRTTKIEGAEPVASHRRKKAAPVEVVSIPEPVAEAAAPHVAPKFTITREDIARLAFSHWERRGYQGGSAEEDWLLAERELSNYLPK